MMKCWSKFTRRLSHIFQPAPCDWKSVFSPTDDRGVAKPKPIILGSDVAGLVKAVGRNVKKFQPGDEVFGISLAMMAKKAVTPSMSVLQKKRSG